MIKRILKTILILIIAVLLVAGSYVAYVFISYHRIDDNQPLTTQGEATKTLEIGREISLMTMNFGFGAYCQDFSFFMDGGIHSRAYSEATVRENVVKALGTIDEYDPDILLLQEIDINGTRSHHVNEMELFSDALKDYCHISAVNYDSAYLMYPFTSPHGANKSGIMTFSKFELTDGLRRSLPIETGVTKILDLDRCYTSSRIPTSDGKELVVFDLHLSAYTTDGTIADDQVEMLCKDMQAEYDKGNYVIAGGDFNKDLLGDSGKYFTRPSSGEYTWAQSIKFDAIPEHFEVFTGTNAPSCRNCDKGYAGDGTDFVVTVDGIIASDNVSILTKEIVDLKFEYTDHNPTFFTLVLGETNDYTNS